MKPEIKKMLILNAPYLIFVYAFDKIGQAFRLAPGADLTGKLLSIGDGFSAAFSNALPSFDPTKHPNYKYLSDYDKKNTFDMEKHLRRRPAIVKPDEVFDYYEVDAAELE